MITINYESIIKKNPKLPLLFCSNKRSPSLTVFSPIVVTSTHGFSTPVIFWSIILWIARGLNIVKKLNANKQITIDAPINPHSSPIAEKI